jgi:hypothetical protein
MKCKRQFRTEQDTQSFLRQQEIGFVHSRSTAFAINPAARLKPVYTAINSARPNLNQHDAIFVKPSILDGVTHYQDPLQTFIIGIFDRPPSLSDLIPSFFQQCNGYAAV